MWRQRKTQILLVVALVIGLALVGIVGTSAVRAQGPGGGTPYPGQGHRGWGNGGMMGGHGMMDGWGMMQGPWSGGGTPDPGQGNRGWGYGGMMGGHGMMNGWGMMSGWGWTPPANLIPAGQALTIDNAVTVGKAYLASWGNSSTLKLGEVMQFSQNFYVQAVESSGRGAFEFLIDPRTGTLWPEPGPNMMWNLRYGMMNDHMGLYANGTDRGETMPVSSAQAHQAAQAFLDKAQPGTKISEDATAFYGYYTMDFSRDGKVVGMLSVNGYTGQVWLHTWHGDFVTELAPSSQ